MALTSTNNTGRSLLGNVAGVVVSRFDQLAVTLFGHHLDEDLPSNVERHGRHLLARVSVSTEPGSRYS